MIRVKSLFVTLSAVALFAVASAQPASATTILIFGQNGGANTVTSTDTAGTTTISGTDVAVTLTAIENGIIGTQAFLDFSFTSSGTATLSSGEITQSFGGTFSICSTASGCATNYLTGTFSDQASGSNGGAQLTLGASTPGDTVTFTSGVITSLGLDRSLSFAFTNLSSPLSIVGNSINSFTASAAGNMSANIGSQVPEPFSMVLVGSGLLLAGRRRFAARKC
jgi:hypothetical protein